MSCGSAKFGWSPFFGCRLNNIPPREVQGHYKMVHDNGSSGSCKLAKLWLLFKTMLVLVFVGKIICLCTVGNVMKEG